MRTPGLGDNRFSSTSGVLPIDWTMSPYLPPQGRLPKCGSSIASESVVLQLRYVVLRESMLAGARYEQIHVVGARPDLRRLLLHYLVRNRHKLGSVEAHVQLAPAVREPGALLGVELAEPERQLVQHAPHRAPGSGHDVDHAGAPADRAPQE